MPVIDLVVFDGFFLGALGMSLNNGCKFSMNRVCCEEKVVLLL